MVDYWFIWPLLISILAFALARYLSVHEDSDPYEGVVSFAKLYFFAAAALVWIGALFLR